MGDLVEEKAMDRGIGEGSSFTSAKSFCANGKSGSEKQEGCKQYLGDERRGRLFLRQISENREIKFTLTEIGVPFDK